MSSFSHYPLQKAIYQVLTADLTLMSLITGVFDRPSQGTLFPYVTIGESAGTDWSTKTTAGMEHTLALHIWSREGGRKQAALIMDRIQTLLHLGNFSVDGNTLILSRFLASKITLGDDGWTYQGSMQFHVLLEAN